MDDALRAVSIGNVNLQYWLNGPNNVPDTQDALSIFSFGCLDASASLGDLLIHTPMIEAQL